MTKSNRLFSSMRGKARLSPALGLLIVLYCLQPSSTALALESHAGITGTFTSPAEVNRQCIICHEKQAEDLRKSVHWSWERERVMNNKTVRSGKAMDLSRFGIAAAANPVNCRRCHIGTLPETQPMEPGTSTAINCLICHDTTGTYRPGTQGANLENIARTVGTPSVQNCRSCHDQQCGLAPDTTRLPVADVHLQRYGFTCQHCHPSEGHHNLKRRMTTANQTESQGCAHCHTLAPHSLSRLNQHAILIGCQSCHIPEYGRNNPAVVSWNWLLSDNTTITHQQGHHIFSAQGFILGQDITPIYFWDNGTERVYTRGTKILPEQTTLLQGPGARSPASRIMPFTMQYGTQLYDSKYRYLISPKLERIKAPFFDNTDREPMIREGMEKIRLPYSGQYGFTTTVSYRRLNHGVVPANEALDCMGCHGTKTRFNWQQLGYERDPWSNSSENLKTPRPNENLPNVKLPPVRESILPMTPPPPPEPF